MAGALLSEERFLCSVCLDVFTEPVTTPCGHNFCSKCIYEYWDSSDIYQCPLGKRAFSQKPDLQLNSVVSELVAEFKASAQEKPSTPDPPSPPAAEVLCDICPEGEKGNAVKSCLTCLASFCEVHLEPHQRVAGLKGHTLLDPLKNLDERMCKAHYKMTDLYCRTDQTFICVLCIKSVHKSHNVVPLEEECEAAMAKKGETVANIQKVMQSRNKKIAEIERSADASQIEAEREKEASVQVFTDLISAIQGSQAEFVEMIEERYRATKLKADAFLTELRMDVAELQGRSSQLEQLEQSEDHYGFLRSFLTLSSPLNATRAEFDVRCDLSFGAVRDAVTLLKQRVDQITEALPEIKMKRVREHAVDLTFDPDTAYCTLVISQDGKQAICTGTKQDLPDNPKRFEVYAEVLAKEGFTAGKFYYEVQVKGMTKWVLGVVGESVDRKKEQAPLVRNSYWVIVLDGHICQTYGKYKVKSTLKEELEKVGIFVDYNKREVSFYDVNSKSHMYSFTGCRFRETLYPYFCLEDSITGTDSVPFIITPVPQAH